MIGNWLTIQDVLELHPELTPRGVRERVRYDWDGFTALVGRKALVNREKLERWFARGGEAKRKPQKQPPRSPEYTAWRAAQQRCFNPRCVSWPNYGARGITVCDGWLGQDGFERFLAHIGPRPSAEHSLDRIDNDGNYEPGNVRWALPAVQHNNKSDNHRITYAGECLTLTQWAARAGIKPNTLLRRLERGWSMERVLTEPVQKHLPRGVSRCSAADASTAVSGGHAND